MCLRQTEERRGTAAGDESLLCEKRDRAGSETRAEKQRPSTGFTTERSRCTTSQIIAKMHRQLVRLSDAADVAVTVTANPHDTALLLGLVSRTGQT